jgi:uncharacterized repeat protein (TIGR01451 family)
MMQNAIGPNTKRLGFIVLAVTLAVVLGTSVVLLLGMTGGSASAQNEESPLDLELSIKPLPSFVGEQITFYITETNNSNETFPEVAVRDWLPEDGTEYVSATPSQGECFYSSYTHNVFCELGDLPAGGSASVEIVVTTTATGTFTNTVWDVLNNRKDLEYTLRPYIPGQDPQIDAAVKNAKAGLFK